MLVAARQRVMDARRALMWVGVDATQDVVAQVLHGVADVDGLLRAERALEKSRDVVPVGVRAVQSGEQPVPAGRLVDARHGVDQPGGPPGLRVVLSVDSRVIGVAGGGRVDMPDKAPPQGSGGVFNR